MKDKRVLDVTGDKDEEGNTLAISKAKEKHHSQMWKIVYADKAEKTRTKGHNDHFGMDINRPFFLVSRFPMKRVLECIGASNIVIKTLHRQRKNLGQQFFFDEKTKTIKS